MALLRGYALHVVAHDIVFVIYRIVNLPDRAPGYMAVERWTQLAYMSHLQHKPQICDENCCCIGCNAASMSVRKDSHYLFKPQREIL